MNFMFTVNLKYRKINIELCLSSKLTSLPMSETAHAATKKKKEKKTKTELVEFNHISHQRERERDGHKINRQFSKGKANSYNNNDILPDHAIIVIDIADEHVKMVIICGEFMHGIC